MLLASAVLSQWVLKAAERQNLPAVHLGLRLCLAFGLAFSAIRAFEFPALHCSWDTNAYGSAVWTLLGFHTLHLVTDVLDTAVHTVVMFTRRIEGRRFSDVSENSVAC